jgi:hypothetical protein
MKIERAILIAFLGNYIINNVVAPLVALVPASASTSLLTPQYITFVIAAAIVVALLTWWYAAGAAGGLTNGIVFGVVGFVVSIATAFITGVGGVLSQTGSFAQVISVLPNFWPFLASWSTLVLLGYWVIPALLVGWLRAGGKPVQSASSMHINTMPQRPM